MRRYNYTFLSSKEALITLKNGLGLFQGVINGDKNTDPSSENSFRRILKAKGLITRDSRVKERKKPGLKKARKAPQFSKR